MRGDVMVIKSAIRQRVKTSISSAGLAEVKARPVREGLIYCYQKITWELDKAPSGGNIRVRLYIEGHGYNHYIEGWDNPAADTLYVYDDPTWLIPLERLCLEVDQAQASTWVNMHLTGYYTDFKGGIA